MILLLPCSFPHFCTLPHFHNNYDILHSNSLAPDQKGSDDNAGLIAGVVVGVFILLLVSVAVVILVYFMFTRQKEHKKRQAL